MEENSWADPGAPPAGGMQNHQNDGANMAASLSSSLPSLLASSGMEDLDRQIVRQLLSKYTPEGLARLVQEENQSAMSRTFLLCLCRPSFFSLCPCSFPV